MVIEDKERRIARAMWGVAAGMIESRDPAARDLARAALGDPSSETIRALLSVGRDRAWLPSVIDALAQVGIAAADDVLAYRDRPDRRAWAEVIAYMRGGMTIHNVNALEIGGDWWNVISRWVDEQKGLK